jgi:hypothetical protein
LQIDFSVKRLFDYFCVCGHIAYSSNSYFHMGSSFCVRNEYDETLTSGDAFLLAAHFRYVHFVFFSHLNRAPLEALAMASPSLITATLPSAIAQVQIPST